MIPEGWNHTNLEAISSIRRGASPRPIADPKWFSDSGIGWIRIADVTASDRFLTNTTQYLSDEGVSKSVSVEPGDLIMSICGTIGRPIILGIKACIHDGFVLFSEISPEVDRDFLFNFIRN